MSGPYSRLVVLLLVVAWLGIELLRLSNMTAAPEMISGAAVVWRPWLSPGTPDVTSQGVLAGMPGMRQGRSRLHRRRIATRAPNPAPSTERSRLHHAC